MTDDDAKTPKQSGAADIWRQGAENLLDRLLTASASRHKAGEHERGRHASQLANEVATYLERLADSDLRDDGIRVLRVEQFAELDARAREVLAGIEAGGTCATCPRRR